MFCAGDMLHRSFLECAGPYSGVNSLLRQRTRRRRRSMASTRHRVVHRVVLRVGYRHLEDMIPMAGALDGDFCMMMFWDKGVMKTRAVSRDLRVISTTNVWCRKQGMHHRGPHIIDKARILSMTSLLLCCNF
jgi:hypothetical protein